MIIMIKKIDILRKEARGNTKVTKNFHTDAISRMKVTRSEYSTFFKILYSQLNTLNSVLDLSEKRKYRDCFILLRSVFEIYLYFLLMLKGKKYKETIRYHIIPKHVSTPKMARDKTFEKWKREWNEWKKDKPEELKQYDDVIEITPGKHDIIVVTYEKEGLFEKSDIHEEGFMITHYFFMFHEYDPDVNFLASLPTIKAGDLHPSISKKHQEGYKILYNRYFYIKRIIQNLRLNNLITEQQQDYMIVHYNFLSKFLHPNRNIINYIMNCYSCGPEDVPENKIMEELILLYITRFQYLYLKEILDYFKSVNPGNWCEKYENQIEVLNGFTDDVWFIFNKPNEYDILESDRKKMWKKIRGDEINDIVVYYKDPIKHLETLRLHQLKEKKTNDE